MARHDNIKVYACLSLFHRSLYISSYVVLKS